MRFSSAVFAFVSTAPVTTWCVSGRMSGFLGFRVWFCVFGDMAFKIIHSVSTRLRTSSENSLFASWLQTVELLLDVCQTASSTPTTIRS